MGQLPYLTIDEDIRLVQSVSIARFLAEEFNLAGQTSLVKVQANAIVDCTIFIYFNWVTG